MTLSVARRSPVIAVIAVALFLGTCRTLQRSRAPLHAELRTDSTEIGVHFGGELYLAKIGFVFVNTTASPISKAGCGFPPWPEVEKLVNGRWTAAYHPAYLMCRTIPDFVIAPGASYPGVIEFHAAAPGKGIGPTLRVDSIDGTYRLRWVWTEGREADRKNARSVEGISNEFRMVLR